MCVLGGGVYCVCGGVYWAWIGHCTSLMIYSRRTNVQFLTKVWFALTVFRQ